MTQLVVFFVTVQAVLKPVKQQAWDQDRAKLTV
jgi:hypothetical protein